MYCDPISLLVMKKQDEECDLLQKIFGGPLSLGFIQVFYRATNCEKLSSIEQ